MLTGFILFGLISTGCILGWCFFTAFKNNR